MSHYSGIPIVVSIKDNKEERVCVCTASANLTLEMEEEMYKSGEKIMRKITAAGACGILALSMLAGCGSTDTASGSGGSVATATEVETETDGEAAAETDAVATPQADSSDSVLMGRITAIDGDTITISTMGKSGGPRGDSEAPAQADGEMPEKPEGEMPEKPDGEATEMVDGEVPEMADGEEGTASEQTITVTVDTVITIDEKEAVLEDLAVDDMISVKMESGKVVSVSTTVQPQD